MYDQQREIYHSENGDRWLLCREHDGRVFVLHKANVSSGGTATKIELGDFLGRGKAGPEHQALARLIGGLVDRGLPEGGRKMHSILTELRDRIVAALRCPSTGAREPSAD